ncbi:MAG: KWG repeat-containing protein [Limisphaerales bacterium]|nr:MAG: KWG repeat-containing protein [Limisphaerales bacterium]TXT49455.1 MAG: KWG repeat-containing protein [Limisphaerales bacterium]
MNSVSRNLTWLLALCVGWAEDLPAADTNLLPVRVSGRYGYINHAGKMVIQPQFKNASEFFEGLADFQADSGRWGYISTSGKVVIRPQFTMAGRFSEGMAVVRLDKGFHYIRKDGVRAFKGDFDSADAFFGGVARVGFETLKSKLISGFADVGIEVNERYINPKGEFVRKPPAPASAATDLFAFQSGDLFGYTNSAGAVRIKPQFEMAYSFSEGLAPVQVDKMWGAINQEGKLVISNQWHWVYGFKNGVSKVALSRRGGYIRADGSILWQPSD